MELKLCTFHILLCAWWFCESHTIWLRAPFALQSPRWYVYYKHIINWFFFGRDLSWICNHLKLWLVLISGSHQQQIQRPWRDELLKNGLLLHVTWPLRWEKIHDYILSHLCCTTWLDKESQELSTNVKVSWCYSFFLDEYLLLSGCYLVLLDFHNSNALLSDSVFACIIALCLIYVVAWTVQAEGFCFWRVWEANPYIFRQFEPLVEAIGKSYKRC